MKGPAIIANLVSWTLWLVLLVACTHSDAAVEPVWGKQACASCSMILSDKNFGAEAITAGGDRLFFDDVGCMVMYMDERHASMLHTWVREANTGAWIDAATAGYVSGAKSPMDFGFEAHAREGVSWDAMRERVRAKVPGGQ